MGTLELCLERVRNERETLGAGGKSGRAERTACGMEISRVVERRLRHPLDQHPPPPHPGDRHGPRLKPHVLHMDLVDVQTTAQSPPPNPYPLATLITSQVNT